MTNRSIVIGSNSIVSICWGFAVRFLCFCPCVCLCLCLSDCHRSVFYRNVWTGGIELAFGIQASFDLFYTTWKLRYLQKIRVRPSGTLSKTADLGHFASAYRSSKHVIECDKLDRRRSTELTIPPSSDARPLQFSTRDRRALSTARCSRAGQWATADTCSHNVDNYRSNLYAATGQDQFSSRWPRQGAEFASSNSLHCAAIEYVSIDQSISQLIDKHRASVT